jgi:anti-sigma factor RsiW
MISRPATPIGETDLQTYVDGRLADERRAEVESWLAARPAEASRIADYRRLRDQCRAAYAGVLEEAVPQDILAALRPARRRPRRFARLAAAIAAGVIIGALGAWQLPQSWQAAPSDAAATEMVRRSAIAHAVYASEIRHPVDGNAAEGDVLAWLSERLRMKVVAPDLQAAGLAFIGGRLLPGERSAAARLMYEAPNGRRATLYWGPEFRSEHETPLRYARGADGTRVYYWIDEECGYAVASADFSENELLVVAAMAYAQLEK